MTGVQKTFTEPGCTAVCTILSPSHPVAYIAGIAIRVMQAIHSLRTAPYPLEPSAHHGKESSDGLTLMIETRTYWACFIMDCMINSGTYNPPMLPMPEIARLGVDSPSSFMDFALGSQIQGQSTGYCPSGPTLLPISHSVEALVSGFDVWAQIMSFVFTDGLKAAGRCAPQNCPWVVGSPWSNCWRNLRDWRERQHPCMHYPHSSVAMHMMLNHGESFTYLNLLYYVWYVFLSTLLAERR